MNAGGWFGFAFGWALGQVFSLSIGREVGRGTEISHYLIIMGLIVVGFIQMYRDSKK